MNLRMRSKAAVTISCSFTELEVIFNLLFSTVCCSLGSTWRYERQRFAAALISLLFGNSIPGHTTREPPMQSEAPSNSLKTIRLDNAADQWCWWQERYLSQWLLRQYLSQSLSIGVSEFQDKRVTVYYPIYSPRWEGPIMSLFR